MAIKVSGTTVIHNNRAANNFSHIKTSGFITATGNVTANSFIGDGSQLTNAGSTVASQTSSNAELFVPFTGISSGTMVSANVNSFFTFNPHTGRLSANSYAGDGSALTGISAGATVTDKSDNVDYNLVFTNETSGTQALAGIDNATLKFNPSTGVCSSPVFTATSDERSKDNISTISDALSKVLSLNGVDFTWKSNGQQSTGLIAQQVEEVIPQVVIEDTEGMKSVNYGALVGVLVQAIKELNDKIES